MFGVGITYFDATLNTAVHLCAFVCAKVSRHFLAVLAFAQVTYTQVVVNMQSTIVNILQFDRHHRNHAC
jgi:hypothetical protein